MPIKAADAAFRDPLANELWRARAEARPVSESAHAHRITATRGTEIAGELYRAMQSAGARQVGWKLALTSEAAQARFGVDRSFSAPVFDATRIESSVLRSAFVEPLLEAEIGVAFRDGAWTALPCVEIADCRFAGWRIDIGQAIADFGLHGAMAFGEPVPEVDTVTVNVSRDGLTVASGSVSVEGAMGRARALRAELGDRFAVSRETIVATGSFIQPVPLVLGLWRLDFGSFGVLELTVAP